MRTIGKQEKKKPSRRWMYPPTWSIPPNRHESPVFRGRTMRMPAHLLAVVFDDFIFNSVGLYEMVDGVWDAE
ncbi:hypothetical protein BC936DRAFT_143606 [Jimgerdemannia flammicorona]|uniref:Uncharacterized protein n=1 Tax=Jimgerdemannia flammicorona TaxID=994334 RepID=A0A433DDQ7_9FUNG|nr:hypothetical protein BC936DRAFT_143606 [Jimgerdemannia flammicorona]